MQISHSLIIEDKNIQCKECRHALGPAKSNWKNSANLDELNMKQLGSPYTTGDKVLLRNFYCPGCGLLLDTELAMPGDPFLEDLIVE